METFPTLLGPFSVSCLEYSQDYAQIIAGQVTEVTCPVIGWAQPKLTLSRRQKTGPSPLWVDPLIPMYRCTVLLPYMNPYIIALFPFVISDHNILWIITSWTSACGEQFMETMHTFYYQYILHALATNYAIMQDIILSFYWGHFCMKHCTETTVSGLPNFEN